jgi:hypothetical protein
MTRRRLVLLLALVVLVLGAVGAARRDAERERTTATSTVPGTATTTPEPLPEGRDVSGTLPADGEVRARVGDTLDVLVTSETPDIAQNLQLGLKTSVGPGIEGRLRFTALQAGTFPIRLQVAGREAGRIVVRQPTTR